jgi:hypothetical protein
MSENFDTLLNELTSFTMPSNVCATAKSNTGISTSSSLDEDTINQYVLNKTSNLIEAGIGAVEDLKDYIVQGQNPDEIAALSELISSTTKAIEALNRINLLNKKTKADKDLKIIELEAKKEIAGKIQNNITHNTNVLVTSRKEIFKQLLTDNNDNVIELNEPEIIENLDNK